MNLVNDYKKTNYFDYETLEKPKIELLRIAKGAKADITLYDNEIVFFLEGHLQLACHESAGYEGTKGQVLFLPTIGARYTYSALAPTELMIFRIRGPILLCDNFPIENLYDPNWKKYMHKSLSRNYSVLEINPPIWHFLKGINDFLTYGIRYEGFLDMKIKEFFCLLGIYYTKEEICNFLYLILSKDTTFSEIIRQQWHQYRTISELAESMRMTNRQFSAKFKEVFGQTPHRWMLDRRAKRIYIQLTTTNLSVKELAFENGFSSISQFTKFCKKELGKNPTEIRAEKKDMLV